MKISARAACVWPAAKKSARPSSSPPPIRAIPCSTLVGAPELPPEFVWHTQSIKMRGSVAKVHLLTDGDHGLPQGTLVIAPAVRYVERAFDAAKYGRDLDRSPIWKSPPNGAVVSHPFPIRALRACATANGARSAPCSSASRIDTAANAFPQLKASIREIRSLTPLDLENTYGLTEGDLNHGQLILDQMFFMRPMPGWSNAQDADRQSLSSAATACMAAAA